MIRRTVTLAALCTLGLVSAALAQAKPNFSGTWKVNIAKSDFGPMPAPQSGVSKIEHADPKLKLTSTITGDMGERTVTMEFTTDGAENTNKFGPMEMKSRLRWEGAELIIESKASSDQGEFTAKERWSLAEGGKIFKLIRSWAGPMGEATQTLIHEKQ